MDRNLALEAVSVTEAAALAGSKFMGMGAKTHSVVMRSMTGTIRFIESIHRF